MAQPLSRRAGFVCASCQARQLPKLSTRPLSTLQDSKDLRRIYSPRQSISITSKRGVATTIPSIKSAAAQRPKPTKTADKRVVKEHREALENPQKALISIEKDARAIIASTSLPTELQILELLERIQQLSNTIVFGRPEAPDTKESGTDQYDHSSGSSILDDLEETSIRPAQPAFKATSAGAVTIAFRAKAAGTLSDIAYQLVRDPKVQIHETVLQLYVRIQCLLGRPQYLPEIFQLYSHKATPTQSGTTINYTPTTPWDPRYAIPKDLADAALEAAIAVKNLPLAIAIIDTTFGTTNHKLLRLISKAGPPFAAMAAIPVIAYAGAMWVSTFQNAWDPEMSRITTLAGTTAYVGTLGTIGFVAVTTWNDHHERIVWQPGTGLWDRWIREDERAGFDKIACAWGFQEKWRRGEEVGSEWEALREVCGLRSLVLDKTDRMEGMQ